MKINDRNKYQIKKLNVFRLFFGMIPNDIPKDLLFPGIGNQIETEDKQLQNKLYSPMIRLIKELKKKNKQEYNRLSYRKRSHMEITSSDILNNFYIRKSNTPSYIFSTGIEPLEYYDFKRNGNLRLMGIENPLSYVIFICNTVTIFKPLLYFIYNNKKYRKLIKTSNSPILENGMLISKRQPYNDRSILGDDLQSVYYYKKFINSNNNNGFNKSLIDCELHEREFPYYMKLDIQSFFPSIYTHIFSRLCNNPLFISIKKINKRRNNNHNINLINSYLTFLDSYNMKNNKNETKGIITGPLSSKISSELLNLAMSYQASSDLKYRYYTRYMDDMVVFSKSIDKLNRIHLFIENFLEKYKLTLQMNKFKLERGLYIPKIFADLEFIYKNINLINNNYIISSPDDFLNLKININKLISNKKFSTMKALFTILGKEKITFKPYNSHYNEVKFQKMFIDLLLKIALIYPYLTVSIFRLIRSQIKFNDITESANNNGMDIEYDITIFTELNSVLGEINNNYSNTVLQIWTYYLVNLLINKYINNYNHHIYSHRIFNNIFKLFKSYNKKLKNYKYRKEVWKSKRKNIFKKYVLFIDNHQDIKINPLIILSFIFNNNDKKFVNYIYKYVEHIYNIDTNETPGNISIINSKWAFVIFILYEKWDINKLNCGSISKNERLLLCGFHSILNKILKN